MIGRMAPSPAIRLRYFFIWMLPPSLAQQWVRLFFAIVSWDQRLRHPHGETLLSAPKQARQGLARKDSGDCFSGSDFRINKTHLNKNRVCGFSHRNRSARNDGKELFRLPTNLCRYSGLTPLDIAKHSGIASLVPQGEVIAMSAVFDSEVKQTKSNALVYRAKAAEILIKKAYLGGASDCG